MSDRYRKKPVVINAKQFTNDCIGIMEWVESFDGETPTMEFSATSIKIHTLEGVMEALPGDFIIRGIQGEFYPCKPDIFDASYELDQ